MDDRELREHNKLQSELDEQFRKNLEEAQRISSAAKSSDSSAIGTVVKIGFVIFLAIVVFMLLIILIASPGYLILSHFVYLPKSEIMFWSGWTVTIIFLVVTAFFLKGDQKLVDQVKSKANLLKLFLGTTSLCSMSTILLWALLNWNWFIDNKWVNNITDNVFVDGSSRYRAYFNGESRKIDARNRKDVLEYLYYTELHGNWVGQFQCEPKVGNSEFGNAYLTFSKIDLVKEEIHAIIALDYLKNNGSVDQRQSLRLRTEYRIEHAVVFLKPIFMEAGLIF